MTKIKKGLFSILAIILFFIIALASNPSKHTFGNSEKWIPKDFVPGKTILLVEKFTGNKKQAQIMEDYMGEKYSNKYEFVSLNTIHNREGKYANTKLYKYALISSYSSERMTKQNGGSTNAGVEVGGTDFNFYDRDSDKNYPTTKKPSSSASLTFKAVINTIEKELE